MDEKTPPSKPPDPSLSAVVLQIFLGEGVKLAVETSLGKTARPIDLISSLTENLGKEWIVWEPETLWSEIKRIYAIALPEALKSKIQASRSLLVTDAFWRDHLAFEKITVSLNNHVPLFDQYQHPSPGMAAYAINEARKIRDGKFSDDVLKYIAAIAFQEGLLVLPEPLDVAQESLDEMTRPVVGRHWKDDIERRWREHSENKEPASMYTETLTGIQLARMASIQEYARTA